MSIEAMKQALEALEKSVSTCFHEYAHEQVMSFPEHFINQTITALRAAIDQAEKQSASGSYVSWDNTLCNPLAPAREQAKSAWYDGYKSAKAEQYDQTSLELCEECGWKAIIPGDGCLVCARQKARPVAWMYDFMADDRDEVIRDWTTQDYADIEREKGFNVRPLYTAPQSINDFKPDWDTVKAYDEKFAEMLDEQQRLRAELKQAKRQWVGLTDEEIKEIIGPWGDTPIKGYTRKLFDQIEAKLKEKNK